MTKESRESENAYERYKQIIDLLNEISDQKGLKLVKELVEKCRNYIKITLDMERFVRLQEALEQSPEEYQRNIKNFDQRKRISHEALISQLAIVNRYVFKNNNLKGRVPIGGIYSLDPNTIVNRNMVGDWAYYLVNALVRRGIIETIK